jgi:glycosyltransferase involved in cell wall biosynthesis
LAPIEIVVSDDASDDGTQAVVDGFASMQSIAVRYLRCETRRGVVATRNAGITAAQGEWIANCDSDDFWAPTKLERQAAFVRDWSGETPIALLGTYGYNTNDVRRVLSTAAVGATTESEYLELRRNGTVFFAIHSSVLFARTDFLAVGGYTADYGAADDFEFFCKVGEIGAVISIAEPLTYYRKRIGSIQASRYWDQRRQAMRLGENRLRQLAGDPPFDHDAFKQELASRSLKYRVGLAAYEWGMYHYRVGAVALVNGQTVRGVTRLALAAILDRSRVRTGIRSVWHASSDAARASRSEKTAK